MKPWLFEVIYLCQRTGFDITIPIVCTMGTWRLKSSSQWKRWIELVHTKKAAKDQDLVGSLCRDQTLSL